MRTALITATILLTILSCTKSKEPRLDSSASDAYFKFHLLSEPSSYDPAHIRGVSGSYLFSNIYRSLYTYTEKTGLTPEGAEACIWKNPLKLECILKKHFFSDGQEVKSKHYVNSISRVFKKEIKSLQAENFIYLKNAKDVLDRKKPISSLGVEATSDSILTFNLVRPDPDFLYKLTYPATSPTLKSFHFDDPNQITSFGPYVIKKSDNRSIILKKNPFYFKPTERPPVKIVFVDSHLTALTLYETKKLNFLRLMFTEQAARLKNEKGFFKSPLARFDYIGFGPRLKNKHELRKQLTQSLDYNHLAKLLMADVPPGCPSLLPKLYDPSLCYKYQPKLLKKVNDPLVFSYQFSNANGDDISKQVEWMQHRWKKYLGLKINIEPQEEKSFYKTLKFSPPDFFRKGLPLNRPTCLAALENFKSHHPDNLIKVSSKELDKIIDSLSKELKPLQQKILCNAGISYLLKNNLIIPMGLITMPMIHDTQFKNWSVNSLNQLDLSELSRANQ